MHFSLLSTRRRTHFFWFGILLAILSACATPPQQPKHYTIGIVSLADSTSTIDAFKQTLAEAGFREDQNITYIYNGPTATLEQMPMQVQKLREAQVDAVFAISSPMALEVQKQFADTQVPVVFLIVTNPVQDKLVASQSAPGGTMTGVTQYGGEPKRLEWLRLLAPKAKRIFFPYGSRGSGPKGTLTQLEPVVDKLGFELILRPVESAEELTAALEQMPADIDAILIAPDALVSSQAATLGQIALDRKIPLTVTSFAQIDMDGALMSYGYDSVSSGQQSARLMVKILQGADPGTIPVETAEFGLRLNLKTATAIGISIDDQTLRQAVQIVR